MTALLKDALKPNLVQTLETHPRLHPRRALRQHCPRLQQRHGHHAGHEAGRLCGYRGRLRRRPGRREVPGHQVPRGRAAPRRCGAGGHRPCAEVTTAALPRPDLSKPNARGRWRPALRQPAHVTSRICRKSSACRSCVAINAFPTDTEEELAVIVTTSAPRLGVPVRAERGVGQGRRGRQGPGREPCCRFWSDTAQVKLHL